MSADRSAFTRRALVALALLAVIAVAAVVITRITPEDSLTVRLHTSDVAGGITPGATALLNGAAVGKVTDVTQDGEGRATVTLEFTESTFDTTLLTTSMEVSYAPRNLFGISAVVLRARGGGDRLRDNSDFTPGNVADSTLSTLLRNLSDLNNQAFRPYISDILDRASQATMGLVPILQVAGQLGASLAATQKVPPAQTFPQFAGLVDGASGALEQLLPALAKLIAWPAPQTPGYNERQSRALDYTVDPFLSKDLGAFLGPSELALLNPVAPTLVQILQRVQTTFPDARANGLQLNALIDRIRAAMPTGPNGPVLNVDIALAGVPAVTEALRGAR